MVEEIIDLRQRLIERLNQKTRALRDLDTKQLIARITELEDKLETSLREESSFKNLNSGFLASSGSDCAEARRIIAELSARVPEYDERGGTSFKLTAPQKEAWLIRQRTENQDLNGALGRQKDVAFELENQRIAVEMAKKRLESAKAVLGLRTAQINFLSE